MAACKQCDGRNAIAFVIALDTKNTRAWQDPLTGPKRMDHMLKLDAFIQTVHMEIEMFDAMGDVNKGGGCARCFDLPAPKYCLMRIGWFQSLPGW